MRLPILSCFLLFFLAKPGLQAQRLSALDTGKYKLLLPSYWKPGHKAWRILDELLITKIPELLDKEICGDDCNPAHRVEFFMSNPVIEHYRATHVNSTRNSQTWNIITQYSFEAALLLFDHRDQLLTRILLIDPEETWRKLNRVEWMQQNPASGIPRPLQAVMVPPPGSPAGQDYLLLQQQQQMGAVTPPPVLSPRDFIYRNPERLFPTQQDLFSHVDDRIRSLRVNN